jgi:hypothetical protein
MVLVPIVPLGDFSLDRFCLETSTVSMDVLMMLHSMLSKDALHEHQNESKERHVPDPFVLHMNNHSNRTDSEFHDFALR